MCTRRLGNGRGFICDSWILFTLTLLHILHGHSHGTLCEQREWIGDEILLPSMQALRIHSPACVWPTRSCVEHIGCDFGCRCASFCQFAREIRGRFRRDRPLRRLLRVILRAVAAPTGQCLRYENVCEALCGDMAYGICGLFAGNKGTYVVDCGKL